MKLRNFTNKNSLIFHIISTLIFLCMGMQIILGMLWAVGNFTAFQLFPESLELLEVSTTWKLDEYLGIVYPVCLWLAQKIEQWTGVSYTACLYGSQLLAAFFSGTYFLNRTIVTYKKKQKEEAWKLYYGGAYLLTFPLLLQLHLAILPFSFAFSALVVLLADCIWMIQKGLSSWKLSLKMGLLWLVCGMLLPDYGWLCGISIIAAAIVISWKRKKIYKGLLLMLVSVPILMMLLGGLIQEPGSRGRIQKSIGASMVSRFVWPNFYRNAYFWNTYITDILDDNSLLEISQEPENVIYMFGPAMENSYGRKKAEEVYRQMGIVSLSVRTKDIAYQMGTDALSYLCPPIAVQRNLSGEGASYTGFNYSRMSENRPELTKHYMKYSLWGWNVMAILSAVLLIRKRNEIFLHAITVFVFAIWYTISYGGMQDYRNVMIVNAFWVILIIKYWLQVDRIPLSPQENSI